MTRMEAYDLARTKWKDPAAVELGERCILGEWLVLGELRAEDGVIMTGTTKGVQVRGEGASWSEAVVAAGLTVVALVVSEAPFLARKEPKEFCPTHGCGQEKKPGDAFCSRCFEEHRDQREIHEPSPPSRK